MSQDEVDPLRRLQVAIDQLGDHEDIQENVYLDACNALKELHSLSKLYRVTYYEFAAVLGDHGPVVEARKRVRIMPRDEHSLPDVRNWSYPLDHGSLPRDMTRLPLNEPFGLGDYRGIVTECVPYLKRRREGAEN